MPDLWMDVDTALSEVPVNIMPLLDDTDFKTRETAIAYNAAGMDLVWNFVTTGGAFTQTAVTPTTGGAYDWTHQGDGMYTIEIPASGGASINNDTEGFGWFTGVVTGVLPWRGPTIGFRAAGLNDALIDSAYSTTRGLAGTALPNAAAEAAGGLFTRGTGAGQINQPANGRIDANTITVSGTTQTARDLGASVLLSPGTGTGQVSLSSGAVTVGTNNDKTGYSLSAAGVQAIWDALTSALTTVGSIGKRIADYLDVAVSGRASQTSLNTLSGDTSTGIAAIKNQTDQLTFSTGGVDANVAAIGGDTAPAGNLQIDYDGTGYNKAASTIGNVDNINGTYASAFFDGVIAPYFTLLARKDPNLASLYMETLATINVDAGGGAGTYDNTTDSLEAVRDRGDVAWVTGTTPPTVGAIADAVWDEALAGHLAAGSTGNALNAAGSAGDPWSTALPGAYGAGTAGKIVGDNLNATVSSRATQTSVDTIDDLLDTEVGAIKAKTDNLPTDPAGQSAVEAAITASALTGQAVRDAMKLTPTPGGGASGSVDYLLAAIAGDVESIFNDTDEAIPAQIAALNNLSSAQVNAEMVDVLRTDTIPDSYAADGAQPTFAQAVLAIQQFLTEKAVSGTTVTVKKPDGTTTAMTLTLNDGSSPTSITRAS